MRSSVTADETTRTRTERDLSAFMASTVCGCSVAFQA
jgi:hypothetical protein